MGERTNVRASFMTPRFPSVDSLFQARYCIL
jgi:hypothetical protein